MRAAGFQVENEVSISGKLREADVFVSRWTNNEPVAIDITVTHPLAPSLGIDAQAAREILINKEKQKIIKNKPSCNAVGVHFIPFPM